MLEKINDILENKKILKYVIGGCFAALTLLSLIQLVLHFSAGGLFVFIGAALMTAGMFVPNMPVLTTAGFGVSALAGVIDLIWCLTWVFRWDFRPFYLLFPLLCCILLIAAYVVLIVASFKTSLARWMGIGAAGAAFAMMMIVVGAFCYGFSGYYANYLTYLARMIMIPAFLLFGLVMADGEPVLKFQKREPRPRPMPQYNQGMPYDPNQAPYNPGQVPPQDPNQLRYRRPQAANPMEDQIERLQKLKEMADQGIITEEEFQAKKAEILNGNS